MAITMTSKANGMGKNSIEQPRRQNQASRTNQIVLAVGRVLRGVEEVEETVVLHLQHKTDSRATTELHLFCPLTTPTITQ
jgi:hypothetical protein